MNNEATEATEATERSRATRSLLYGRNLRKIAQLALRGMPNTAAMLRDLLAAGERIDWRDYTGVIRAARDISRYDPLTLPLAERSPLPSRLTLAESLRNVIESLSRDGNVVAHHLAQAMRFRHNHNPSLFGNFFAFRERAGMISYCPKNREQAVNDDGTWVRKNRQEISPAKWARKILPDRINSILSDANLSAFAAAFAAREKASEVRIEVVETAKEINHSITELDVGACMESEDVGPWYVAQGCKLVCVVNGNDVTIARAILWPSVVIEGVEGEVPMLERIYARSSEPISRPALEQLLINYAREIGAWWKVRQSNSCTDLTNDGETWATARYAIAKVDPMDCHFLPYLDTWYHVIGMRMYGSRQEVCNVLDDGDQLELFRSTSGGSETAWVYDGELSSKDRTDMVRDVDGEWIDLDDAVYCEDDSEYYCTDDSRIIHCDSYDDYRLRENCRSVEIGRTTYIVHEDHIGNA